jgi:putative salt-induced outer membrane protein YdiY
MIKSSTFALLVCTLVLPVANGADWTGGIEGGSVIQDGDTATRLRIKASLDERPLSHYVYAEWVRSDTSSYELGYKPRYWFNDNVYGFGEGRVRLDDAVSIDRDTLLIGGLGIQLIATEARQVSLEAGVGYQLIDYAEVTGLDEIGSGVGVVRGNASQILSDLFRLELNGNIFTSDAYFESNLEAGVSMRLAQGAIKVSHRIRRIDSDGLAEFNDSDTAVAFTVGF